MKKGSTVVKLFGSPIRSRVSIFVFSREAQVYQTAFFVSPAYFIFYNTSICKSKHFKLKTETETENSLCSIRGYLVSV